MELTKETVLELIKSGGYTPMTSVEILTRLEVPLEEINKFNLLLEELVNEGLIYKSKKRKYALPSVFGIAVGELKLNARGFGFLVPEEDVWDGDIYIAAKDMNGAADGDRVVAEVLTEKDNGSRHYGKIERIIKRGSEVIIGVLSIYGDNGVVTPDDPKFSHSIYIDKNNLSGGRANDKCVVKITKWPAENTAGEGEIIELLGQAGAPGVDVMSIIKAHELHTQFPDDVIEQVKNIPMSVTGEMAKGRRDIRNLRIVTIDSEDTKDVDDGVSVEKLSNGHYKLGVHIADVSGYVKQGSPLDNEAYARGTSVYLVDRVLPMLPKELSNGICSLNTGVDRLAFSVVMEIDEDGNTVDHEIFESLVNVEYKITYNQIYSILEEGNAELTKEFEKYIDDLKLMRELAGILGKKRRERGSLDFDFPESKVILDETGKPIEVTKYNITFANNIIEEFMLACNETVAERFYWLNVPFVYRVHEDPDPDKIERLSIIVKNMGFTLKGKGKIHPKAIQELLTSIKDSREERVISTIVLRSMQKAVYMSENRGHFGLAAKYYTHFTSPIRRYPDLLIHRIMKLVLNGKMTEKQEDFYRQNVGEFAKHCSDTERTAAEAEMESVDLKKCEYMKEHEGDLYEGIISNITSFGMFIELDNTVEGLVRYASLKHDHYIFNEERLTATGQRGGHVFSVGDTVKIIVAKVDMAARQIDFELEDEPNKKVPSVKLDKPVRKKVPEHGRRKNFYRKRKKK